MNLGGPELLIVLAVVLLIFGSKKVPELARSLGKAQKEFKDGMKDGSTPDTPVPPASQVTASQGPAGADKTTIDVEARNKS